MTERAPPASPPASGSTLGERVRANACLFATSVIWGSFFPLLDRLLAGWDALSLAAARLGIAAFGLVIVLVLREGWRALAGPLPWRRIWLAGGCGLAGFTLFITFGIETSGPVPAAVISTASPVIALLMAWALGRMHLKRQTLAGVGLAVGGGLLVVFDPAGAREFRGGEIFVLIAAVAWVWQSLMSQVWFAGFSRLRVAALLATTGATTLALVAAAAGLAGLTAPAADLSLGALAILAYLGLIGAGLGNFLWYFGVSRLGVTVASMYNNLIPVFAVLVALALGTVATWYQLAGGALILAGVAWAQRRG